jgi:hypothetical protein
MEKKVEYIARMIDGLDHIEAKIEFMSDACIGISKQDYAINSDASFGMQMFFDEIRNQIAVIKREITEMFHEEIKTAKA